MEGALPKKFKPEPLYPFEVTVKKAGTFIVYETVHAARQDVWDVAYRHRLPLFDPTLSITIERKDA